MERREVYTEEGYRLAPYLLRFASFVVDAAIFVGVTVGLFLLLYPVGGFKTLGDINGISEGLVLQEKYDEASCLYNRVDGQLRIVSSEDFRDYENAVFRYYFEFNAEDNANNPDPHKYSMADFNKNVYDLPSLVTDTNYSRYYVFALNEKGEKDPSLRGELNPALFNEDGTMPLTFSKSLLEFHKAKYQETYFLLSSEPYYKQALSLVKNGTIMVELIASLLPLTVFYLIIPLTDIYGRTIGKRIMKIGCSTIAGIIPKKWQIVLRVVLAFVSIFAAAFLDEITYSMIMLLGMFLISAGFATFGRSRRALHDYVSGLIVVRQEDIKDHLADEGLSKEEAHG